MTDKVQGQAIPDEEKRLERQLCFAVYATAHAFNRAYKPILDELGVTAYGPHAATFAAQLTELLHHWHKERPTEPVITAHPADTPDDQLPAGYHIDRPNSRLTIRWQS